MNNMPCVKQVKSHALWFHGDLIWLMAETLSGLYTDLRMDFPGGSDSKVSAYNVGHLGLIPGSGRSSGGEHGNPHQCSRLEKSHGLRSLVGYSPWGHKESDMTERLPFLSLSF